LFLLSCLALPFRQCLSGSGKAGLSRRRPAGLLLGPAFGGQDSKGCPEGGCSVVATSGSLHQQGSLARLSRRRPARLLLGPAFGGQDSKARQGCPEGGQQGCFSALPSEGRTARLSRRRPARHRPKRRKGSINKKEILVIPGTKFKLPNKHSFSSLNP
jgi:hypothetical protein